MYKNIKCKNVQFKWKLKFVSSWNSKYRQVKELRNDLERRVRRKKDVMRHLSLLFYLNSEITDKELTKIERLCVKLVNV